MPSPAMLAGRAAARLNGLAGRLLFSLPSPLLRRLAGRPAELAADLHPEAWLLAKLSQRTQLTREDVPVDEQRARLALTARGMGVRPPLPLRTTDLTIDGPAGALPARLYVPPAAAAPSGLLVFFHGGGWVQGSVETHDASCRMLAHLAGVRVLSVDYRLAPEHRFPAAVDDAVAAYRWAAQHAERLGADPHRIAVGGDSAGGNLAAVVALAVRDARRAGKEALPPVAFQLLLYPVCDIAGKAASIATYADGFYLTERSMDWFADQYVPDVEQRRDPRVSPLHAPDLSGLPPAYLATSATDPLRDEGEAYAERLRAAGVPVAVQRHGQLHGFFNTTALRSSREGLAQIAGALRQGLAHPGATAMEPPSAALQS